VRHGRLAQEAVEHADELVEPGRELSRTERRDSEHRRVPAHAAGTDAENEASLRHVIERHRLLREVHRVTEVRCRHQRADANARRARGDTGEPRHRGLPRALPVVTPRQVVVGPEVVVTEIVEVLRERARLRPRIRGQHDDTETHVDIVVQAGQTIRRNGVGMDGDASRRE
jgi:hypothetical protein